MEKLSLLPLVVQALEEEFGEELPVRTDGGGEEPCLRVSLKRLTQKRESRERIVRNHIFRVDCPKEQEPAALQQRLAGCLETLGGGGGPRAVWVRCREKEAALVCRARYRQYLRPVKPQPAPMNTLDMEIQETLKEE